MKKYIIGIGVFLSLIIVAIILFFAFKNNNRFVGKWRALNSGDNYYYVFNKDNTCSYVMQNAKLDCTYEIDDTKLIILYNGEKKAKSYLYRFDKEKLVINDDEGKDNYFVPYNE